MKCVRLTLHFVNAEIDQPQHRISAQQRAAAAGILRAVARARPSRAAAVEARRAIAEAADVGVESESADSHESGSAAQNFRRESFVYTSIALQYALTYGFFVRFVQSIDVRCMASRRSIPAANRFAAATAKPSSFLLSAASAVSLASASLMASTIRASTDASMSC
jgi:hypothetical protein